MRVIRHLKGADLDLHLQDDQLIRTPSERQRVWLVNRAVDELADALARADIEAETLVEGGDRPGIGQEGWATREARTLNGTLEIAGQQVMQAWEAPLMERMAARVCEDRGDVLELGFGLGISARVIDGRCETHTIIELNRDVARSARDWAKGATTPTSVEEGSWQEVLPRLGTFDGIFMDTFPIDNSEYERTVLQDETWAAELFAMAAGHLSPGGRLVYYTNEVDSLSRRHQRALLRSFQRFQVEVVEGLQPPDDCAYWWHSKMAVVAGYV